MTSRQTTAPLVTAQETEVIDFSRQPLLVIWEITQSCELICRHCRAKAQLERQEGELSTEEGKKLLDDVAAMGTPVVVLSGGNPLRRPDLIELIKHGKQAGLRMATIPAATDLLEKSVVQELKDAGLDQMALSLDFPDEKLHDDFRGVAGAFARTIRAAAWANECKLPLQINTTVLQSSAPYLGLMAELVAELGAVFWELFFLVPTGRGSELAGLTAEQYEEAFELIYQVQRRSQFVVKVTEAPHYRRYVASREAAAGIPDGKAVEMPKLLRRPTGPGGSIGLSDKAVNSGNGFMFVSHLGDIFPSGFLPLKAGNVRADSIADVYRNSPVFLKLRTPDALLGRCGRCEYRTICAGSRSRAYAMLGNYMDEDPCCAYQPSGS